MDGKDYTTLRWSQYINARPLIFLGKDDTGRPNFYFYMGNHCTHGG